MGVSLQGAAVEVDDSGTGRGKGDGVDVGDAAIEVNDGRCPAAASGERQVAVENCEVSAADCQDVGRSGALADVDIARGLIELSAVARDV